MLRNVCIVAKQEFRSLLKNWITVICIIALVVAPIFVYSPIQSNSMWKEAFAAYQCNNGLVMIAIMIIPIIAISIYYKDEVSEMPVLIFSQPINGKAYAAGKFLGAYSYCLLFGVIENLVWMFMPLYFKQMPYSPLPFLKYFIIYSVPSFLAALAFTYFLEVFFSIKPLTIFLPMFLFMSLAGEKANKYGVIISSTYTSSLYAGNPLSQKDINYILANRIFILTLSVVFIILAILKFSPKKLMDRR